MTVHVAGRTGTLEERFWRFHREHPEVYRELVALSHELLSRGYKRFGIATVYEVCRWRSMLRRGPEQAFKLDNNHRAFYARLIMDSEPDLAGVFETRRQGVPGHLV